MERACSSSWIDPGSPGCTHQDFRVPPTPSVRIHDEHGGHTKLNDTQLAVLRWIADGSPAGVMEGHGHRVSAAARRSRGLIRISGRSTTWRARITAAGEVALGIPHDESEAPLSGTALPVLDATLPPTRVAGRANESRCRVIFAALIRSWRPRVRRRPR